MSIAKAVVAVIIAPLVGALVWLVQWDVRSIQLVPLMGHTLFADGVSDPRGLATLLGVGWLFGLLFTVIICLPIGFAVAFLLRRLRRESFAAYAASGAVAAFFFSMVLPSRSEFWLPITVTGLLLGVSYWLFVRRQAARASGPS